MSFTFLQCEDVNKYLCSQRHIDIWTDKPFHLIASWRTQATRSNSTWGQVKATVHSVIPLTDSKWNHHFTLSSSFSPSWLASIFSSNFTLHGYCLFGPPLSLPNVYIYTYTHTHSVQSLSHVQHFVTPWTAARQTSLSITNSQSLLKFMSIEWVMPSNHLILCCSVVPFSSCLWSFPASESFPMSQFFASGGHNIVVSASASVLPMNTQD